MTLVTPPPLDQEDDEMLVPHSDFATEGPQPMEGILMIRHRRGSHGQLKILRG
ncbi:hypothetical protein CsSME_00027890 [Camellia sinensis var. sinensis]